MTKLHVDSVGAVWLYPGPEFLENLVALRRCRVLYIRKTSFVIDTISAGVQTATESNYMHFLLLNVDHACHCGRTAMAHVINI